MQVKIHDSVLSKEFRQFHNSIQDHIDDVGGDVGGILRETAPKFAGDLVVNTTPVRRNHLTAIKVGRNAVKRDIGRAYFNHGRAFRIINDSEGKEAAAAFYAMLKNGKLSEAEKMLRRVAPELTPLNIIPWDSGTHHQSGRDNKGRYPPRHVTTIADDSAAVKSYTTTVANRVGYAKAGWINGLNQFPGGVGASRVPPAISMQRAPGRTVDNTRNRRREILFENNVPYIMRVFKERGMRRALGFRAGQIQRDIEKVIGRRGKRSIAHAKQYVRRKSKR